MSYQDVLPLLDASVNYEVSAAIKYARGMPRAAQLLALTMIKLKGRGNPAAILKIIEKQESDFAALEAQDQR